MINNNNMNYEKHYNLLIEKSRARILEGYTERHHIVPKCLGGTDDAENIAVLTAEEHFLAHQLLVKMYPNSPPLVNAVLIMTTHHTTNRVNNKLYGWLRKRASWARKEWLAVNGHPRGMLNKKHTEEKKRQIGVSAKKSMIEAVGVKVYAYNLDGTFYKEYATLTDCALDLETSPSNVKYTAEGKFSHCKGKQLRYNFVEELPPRQSRLAGVKKQQYVCPHCNKEGAGPAMKRFHFDNCKEKNQ